MATVVRPVQLKPIEAIQLNEGSEMKPLRLSEYIANPPGEESAIEYQATLANGKELPTGLTLSADGVISGRPIIGTYSATPYEVRVIAKNRTAVPLVVRFELYIYQGQAATGEIEAVESSEALEELLQREHLSEEEYNELYLLYMIRKWGAICIFDAGDNVQYYGETVIYEGGSGWTIYDDGALLRTTNPHAVSTTFSSSGLINTMSEMIAIAAGRGWEKVGVMGCAPGLGYQLINEHNAAEMTKSADERHTFTVDNPMYAVEVGPEQSAPRKQPG